MLRAAPNCTPSALAYQGLTGVYCNLIVVCLPPETRAKVSIPWECCNWGNLADSRKSICWTMSCVLVGTPLRKWCLHPQQLLTDSRQSGLGGAHVPFSLDKILRSLVLCKPCACTCSCCAFPRQCCGMSWGIFLPHTYSPALTVLLPLLQQCSLSQGGWDTNVSLGPEHPIISHFLLVVWALWTSALAASHSYETLLWGGREQH